MFGWGNVRFRYSHSTVTRRVSALKRLVVSCSPVSPRARTWRFVIGEFFCEALQGCTHLYSPLSTLFVLTPRGVVTTAGQ